MNITKILQSLFKNIVSYSPFEKLMDGNTMVLLENADWTTTDTMILVMMDLSNQAQFPNEVYMLGMANKL
jgi:hypothetical protein